MIWIAVWAFYYVAKELQDLRALGREFVEIETKDEGYFASW
jgi:hypothetical protein